MGNKWDVQRAIDAEMEIHLEEFHPVGVPGFLGKPDCLSHPNCAKCHAEPTIAAELEAEIFAKFGFDVYSAKLPCTGIYLPATKWDKWCDENGYGDDCAYKKFHGIPVYSYGGDKIHYCTCE